MNIAVIQTDNLPYDKAKLSILIQRAKKEKSSLVLLPEYVLNRFFKELEVMPISFIYNQTKHQLKHLKHLSKVYDIPIIAPLIRVVKDKKYKVIAKIDAEKVKYYYQQVYMPYSHWREDKFFDKHDSLPMTFSLGNIKFGVMFGFESHIEKFWQFFNDKNVDCVLIPSVSTFNSHNRWLNMLKTKAFLNHKYVIRANRIGNFEDWEFYGRSFGINPEGEVINILGNKEEIGIFNISKDMVKEAKKEWKFLELNKSIKHF